MKKLRFEKQINAPAQKVWDVLWSDESYSEWTQHFSPGSKMIVNEWKVGGTAKFVDADGKMGMINTITSLNEPYELVFSAKGVIKDGAEDYDSEEVKKAIGAQEGYELSEVDGVTTLTGFVEAMAEYEEHMRYGFEKGFEEVKKLAEK